MNSTRNQWTALDSIQLEEQYQQWREEGGEYGETWVFTSEREEEYRVMNWWEALGSMLVTACLLAVGAGIWYLGYLLVKWILGWF